MFQIFVNTNNNLIELKENKMKITVRKKEPEVKQLFIKDVPVGYVFEILDSGAGYVKALKLWDEKAVLLKYSAGNDWFELLDNESWSDSPVRILGELTEIIVQQS